MALSRWKDRGTIAALAGLATIVAIDLAYLAWFGAPRATPAPASPAEPTAEEAAWQAPQGGDEDPFRVVESDVDRDEPSLEVDFPLHTVDFSLRISGDVENLAPIKVIVQGTGDSVDAARAVAFRAAVRQALGNLADASALLEHAEAVEREILAQSPRFVLDHQLLEQTQTGKSVRMRICASICRGELTAALRTCGIETPPDGP